MEKRKEPLTESLKFRQYIARLAQNGQNLLAHKELYTIRRDNGEVLFALVHLTTQDAEGQALPPALLLRGQFVAVLTCLIDAETQARYLVLVKQKRVATGGYFYEHPAGMADSEANPYQAALKELAEETTLVAQANELHLLHPEPLFTSPGLLDEAGYFFYYEKTASAAEIAQLQNLQTGHAAEDERILLEVVPWQEAFGLLRNANGLLQLYLYAHLRNLPLPAPFQAQ